MYFREYFCSFSSKSYYFYILGVSHLNDTLPSPLVAIFILTRDPGASTGPLSDLLRQTKEWRQAAEPAYPGLATGRGVARAHTTHRQSASDTHTA